MVEGSEGDRELVFGGEGAPSVSFAGDVGLADKRSCDMVVFV